MNARRALAPAAPAIALTLDACTRQPMGYLEGAAGPAAAPVQALGQGFVAIACLVVLVIAVCVVLAIVRGKRAAGIDGDVVRRGGHGIGWIVWGVGLSLPVLAAMALWNFVVTRAVASAPGTPAVTIEVTAHRWWWEARYRAERPDALVTTANEIVIPTGVPVRLWLTSGDVIHDFWVPKLGPKMDMIPGRWNATWLQADAPGTYVGQCAEFCGLEHAKMGLRVVALAPARFAAWRAAMVAPVIAPTGAEALAGQAVFERSCAGCHAVRGTPAGGIYGPDLSHLGRRATLAAGLLPNTPAGRRHWLAATQQVKPGALMPQVALARADLDAVNAYLGTLQ
jgi:cytochrome c oxidase subunit 2